MRVDRHLTHTASLVLLAAVSCLGTGCPGDGGDPSDDAGAPMPDDASPVDVGSEGNSGSTYCWADSWDDSWPCKWCTQDDGAQYLGAGVSLRGIATEGERAWYIDGSYNAEINGKTTLFTLLMGQTGSTSVASIDGHVTDFEQHDGRLFWTTEKSKYSDPFESGALETMTTTGGAQITTLIQGNVTGVVPTPKGLVVGRLDRLQLVSFDGAASVDLAPKNNPYCPFAVYGETLAWLEDAGCITLRVMPLAGGQPQDVANVPYSEHVAIDDINAYVGTLDGLIQIPLGGGMMEVISSAWAISFGAGAGWLYWTELPPTKGPPTPMLRRRNTGGAVELVALEISPAWIARVDESRVYFVETHDQLGDIGCIKRKHH